MSGRQSELETGSAVLHHLSGAVSFNTWMAEQFLPYCKGDILEVGSGTGNISSLLLKKFKTVSLSNMEPYYNNIVKNRFSGEPSLKQIISLDIIKNDFNDAYAGLLGKFDTVIAINVVEHIEDDTGVLLNCRKLLKPNGHLIVLVPAYQQLFNRLDINLGHCRRYTKKSLVKKLPVNMDILSLKYFNLAGIPGWFITGNLLRNKKISKGKVGLFNKLVPVFKLFDKLVFHKMGLSVIMVARNNSPGY